MGFFDRVKGLFKSEKEVDECASGYPDWVPSDNWKPDFEDELTPEEYDAN